jgi:hypothetical protein
LNQEKQRDHCSEERKSFRKPDEKNSKRDDHLLEKLLIEKIMGLTAWEKLGNSGKEKIDSYKL